MAERKKATPTKASSDINVTFEQYEKMTPAKQKATIRRLRDTEKRSWRSIRLAWGKAPGFAQRQYRKQWGEDTFKASKPLGNVGRPIGSKNKSKGEPTEASSKKAPARRKASARKAR